MTPLRNQRTELSNFSTTAQCAITWSYYGAFLSSSGFSGFDPLDLNLDLLKFETIGGRIDWLAWFTTALSTGRESSAR